LARLIDHGGPKVHLKLIEHPDILNHNQYGETFLICLAKASNSLRVQRKLLTHPDAFKSQDGTGATIFHALAEHGLRSIRKELLKHPNVIIKNNVGETPLHLLAKTQIPELQLEILNHPKVGKRKVRVNGFTPLHTLAYHTKFVEIAKQILKHPLADEVVAKNGETPVGLLLENSNVGNDPSFTKEYKKFLKVSEAINWDREATASQRQDITDYKGLIFEIWFEPMMGYYAKGRGEIKDEITKQYFDKHDDAIEHAEMEIDGYLGED
jgi:ankyrin repeat protein